MDVEAIAARYRPDAPYRSHPFREATTARAYLTWAFEEQVDLRSWFGHPVVDEAAGRAVVEYWGIISTRSGQDVSVAGTSVLRFDDDGLVAEHRDYWSEQPGAVEPPPGFGT
jgi:hypothetical protein